MECLVELGGRIAELLGIHGCLIATAIPGSACLVAILVAVLVGGATLMALLAASNPPSYYRVTVARRLERSAGVVTRQVDPMQAQVSAIRKDAQKKADQAVKQTIEDIETLLKRR